MSTIQAYIHPLADVHTTLIGGGTRIWQYVVILQGAVIGNDCNICSHCLIEGGVQIGDRVTIKSGVQLWDGLCIGDDVFIGPNVTFANDKYPKSRNRNFVLLETHVEEGVSIGGGAVILPGLRLGKGAIVGAGAVVTTDVAAGTTVVGNPARVLKKRDQEVGV
jgi:UDP-2-acetamido-3-amino-2,3-dideoxy-glucuronate N-acetyltransferase